MNRTNNIKTIGFALLCILLVLLIIYSGFRVLEATVFLEEEESNYVSKTIEIDGKKYFPNQNIETFLIIGVDETGEMVKREAYENNAMADAIMVVIFDKDKETMNIVSLNRDTIMDVPVIGIDGRKAGTTKGQLALSYAYGDGMHGSCENTIDAVSDLLYGIKIDHYIALNMDAIKILNDSVGGVTVNVKDDFSGVDSSIKKGKITLRGDQALTFIRARKGVGSQLNVSRMERQQEYMKNFFVKLKDKATSDAGFAVNTYDKLASYMVTDSTAKALSAMMERYGEYELKEMVTPKGENVRGEYMEFYLDEDAFEDMVIKYFFVEK